MQRMLINLILLCNFEIRFFHAPGVHGIATLIQGRGEDRLDESLARRRRRHNEN